MRPAALVLAVLAMTLSGVGFTAAAMPALINRRGRMTVFMVGIAVGIGLWSSSFMLLVVNRLARPGAMITKDIILAGVGLGLLATIRRTPEDSIKIPDTAHAALPRGVFALMAILAATGFVAQSIRRPNGDWDAWAIWNTRARFLLRTADLRLIFHPALPHPDYPTLLPCSIAQVWMLSGGQSMAAPAMIAAFFAALCVGLLVCAIAMLGDARLALLAGAVLLGTPEFTRQAANQYADVPMALYLLATCVVLFESSGPTHRSGRPLILCGLLASLMAWTKNEGLLYALCVAASILLPFGNRVFRRRLTDMAWFVAGAAPLLIFLWWFKHVLAPPGDLILASSSRGILMRLHEPARYAYVAGAFFWRMVLINRWNLFLLAVPAIWLVRICRGSIAPQVGQLMFAMSLMIAGLGMVYVLTPFNLSWHVSSSMSRLIVQLWPSALFVTAMGLRAGIGQSPRSLMWINRADSC